MLDLNALGKKLCHLATEFVWSVVKARILEKQKI